jgi:hypothetical protein
MKLMFFVMNNVDHLDPFIFRLKESGIKGATILHSTGMGRMLAENDDLGFDLFGSLRTVLNGPHTESRVLMMALEDSQVEIVEKIIDEIVGDLSKPNTGILFTLPIEQVRGYKG